MVPTSGAGGDAAAGRCAPAVDAANTSMAASATRVRVEMNMLGLQWCAMRRQYGVARTEPQCAGLRGWARASLIKWGANPTASIDANERRGSMFACRCPHRTPTRWRPHAREDHDHHGAGPRTVVDRTRAGAAVSAELHDARHTVERYD